MPTVGELADFLKSARYQVGQIRQAYGDASPAWVARDSAGFIAFTNDLNAADTAIDAVMSTAQTLVNLTPNALMSVTPAGPDGAVFHALGAALKPYQDLFRRLTDAGTAQGAPPIDMSANPQPTAPDLDLQTFVAANKVTTQIDTTAAAAGSAVSSGLRPYAIGAAVVGGLVLAAKLFL
jgi:hypothetical protein